MITAFEKITYGFLVSPDIETTEYVIWFASLLDAFSICDGKIFKSGCLDVSDTRPIPHG